MRNAGSGVSAESGIRTFRDSNGLWEEYDIEEVATPQAWARNPSLVQRFYNERRKQVLEAKPNAAHLALAQLQNNFDVIVITQNVDDLHERAGSSNVIHLHGEILKSRSSRFPDLIYDIDGYELSMDSVCEKGFPLRPHIVWFGESVPLMEAAINEVSAADILIVVGTSLEVYPAASLINYASNKSIKYLIDPEAKALSGLKNLTVIKEKAGFAIPALVNQLNSEL
ncbi:MAG: NAD-dependent deacylase [Bacteroidetes bacterium]|nr:NAD-dependent deacylase [Bacteroidota bacterium]